MPSPRFVPKAERDGCGAGEASEDDEDAWSAAQQDVYWLASQPAAPVASQRSEAAAPLATQSEAVDAAGELAPRAEGGATAAPSEHLADATTPATSEDGARAPPPADADGSPEVRSQRRAEGDACTASELAPDACQAGDLEAACSEPLPLCPAAPRDPWRLWAELLGAELLLV